MRKDIFTIEENREYKYIWVFFVNLPILWQGSRWW